MIDRDAIEKRKRELRITPAPRGHGACKVIYAAPPPEGFDALVAKCQFLAAHTEASQIDRDYRRGGFSSGMRHAR